MGRLMRLLLDTHAFIWAVGSPENLSSRAVEAIADRSNEILVSAASAWEIGTKSRLGKLPDAQPIVQDFDGIAARLGATILPVEHDHAMYAGTMTWTHKDPFDRMLAAQAKLTASALVSRDAAFSALPSLRVLW